MLRAEFIVALLLRIIGVMANEEIPPQRFMLRGAGMKGRHVIFTWIILSPCFQQQHPEAFQAEVTRERTSACSRTDHDVVEFVTRSLRAVQGVKWFRRSLPKKRGATGKDRACPSEQQGAKLYKTTAGEQG